MRYSYTRVWPRTTSNRAETGVGTGRGWGGTGWVPGGDRVRTGWGPGGDRVGTGWGPGGDRMGMLGYHDRSYLRCDSDRWHAAERARLVIKMRVIINRHSAIFLRL